MTTMERQPGHQPSQRDNGRLAIGISVFAGIAFTFFVVYHWVTGVIPLWCDATVYCKEHPELVPIFPFSAGIATCSLSGIILLTVELIVRVTPWAITRVYKSAARTVTGRNTTKNSGIQLEKVCLYLAAWSLVMAAGQWLLG